MSDLQRAMARDVFALKGLLDEALYAFAERIQKENPSMDQLDRLVDEAARGIVLPAAQYVKRTLRRHGVNLVTMDETVTIVKKPKDEAAKADA